MVQSFELGFVRHVVGQAGVVGAPIAPGLVDLLESYFQPFRDIP